MDEALLWLLETIQSIDPLARTLLAGAAMMLETSVLVGLIIPGDTIVVVASLGISSFWEAVLMVVAVLVGAVLGETLGFWLGRWLGPRIRASFLGQRIIKEKNWIIAEQYLLRRGGIAIFLSRFLPILHSLVPLTVGMSGFAFRRFLLWTVPASLIWAVGYVSITALAAEGFRQSVTQIKFAGFIFVGVIIIFLVGIAVIKRWISKHEKSFLDPQESPAAAALGATDSDVAH